MTTMTILEFMGEIALGGLIGMAAGNVAVYLLTELSLERRVRAKKRERKKEEFTPPFLCRFLGHPWAATSHVVQDGPLPFGAPLEICDRCEAGRSVGLFSQRGHSPRAVKRFLAEMEAEKEGKVLRLKGTPS